MDEAREEFGARERQLWSFKLLINEVSKEVAGLPVLWAIINLQGLMMPTCLNQSILNAPVKLLITLFLRKLRQPCSMKNRYGEK